MNTLMEIDELYFSYKGQEPAQIYIDSLCIPEGGLLALLGTSGAGKSTILRLISGLLTPHQGTIKLSGEEITSKAPSARKIGMVFQQPILFPYLDVLANVAFPLRLGELPKSNAHKSAHEYLELVGMSNFAERSVQSLSGGQAQRVALARALAAKPQLLLLDEPFAALDVDIRAEMQELVARLRRELRLTMVLVTHDQREAGILADQVALLENGKILQKGMISDLYRRPISLQAYRAMGGVNEIEGDVQNGQFHSKIGKLQTQLNNGIQGSAVLTFRQEAVVVCNKGDASVRALFGRVHSIRSIGFRNELGIEINGQLLLIESNYHPYLGEVLAIELNMEECQLIPRYVSNQQVSPLTAKDLIHSAIDSFQASAN